MEAQPPSTIKKPIIFIIGSTASGKTKLSLELAKQLKEIEIVNADALQLYKGADIMTAKATIEERKLVPHHLLDILPLEKLDFERKTYFEVASKLIDELHDQNKVPLVVGGTNYYIESLLYSDYDYTSNQTELPEENKEEINKMHKEIAQEFGHTENEIATEDHEQTHEEVPDEWRDLSAQEKHDLLARIDPLIASKVHPNDQKRVENYIKVYIEEDVIPSKKIMKIDSQRKLRYENPLIFWVKDKEKDNLSERIKKRIHEMVNLEGLQEIVRIFEALEEFGPFNFQRGVLQSIGYKEFVDFYTKLKETAGEKGYSKTSEYLQTINNIEDFDKKIKETIEECKRKLIVATEYYAKKQITWIKNRLANHSLLKNRIILLEFTDVSLFQEEVIDRGVGMLKDYMTGNLVFANEDDGNQQLVLITKYKNWKRFECLDCETTLSGEKEYEAHLKSKRHKKTKERIAKHKRNMEMKQFYEKEREKESQEQGIEEVMEN